MADLWDEDDGESSAESGSLHRVTVPAGAAGGRLDRVIADSLPWLSRSRIQALIEAGHVRDETGSAVSASRKVRDGQSFDIFLPEPEPALPVPQAMELSIVYEDEALLVVDKPAGLVVHPAAGNPNGTLVNGLLAHCGERLSGIGGVRRPGIVHRLDRDTSGLMVVAKTDHAHLGLSAQFADRSLGRTYRAVVWGVPEAHGVVDAPIGRDPHDRKRMAVTSTGKRAVTRWQRRRAYGRTASLIDCTLETGRTHQIRVHIAHAGHALLGDPLYGRVRAERRAPERLRSALVGLGRQALHAAELHFRHPDDGRPMRFESAIPCDINSLLETLESI